MRRAVTAGVPLCRTVLSGADAAGFCGGTQGICGIETAFSASYGSGRPIIGILAEYDALSGLSQKGGCTEKAPLIPGGTGHGCGHNMLGAGALGVKYYLEQTGCPGTVVLWRRGQGVYGA